MKKEQKEKNEIGKQVNIKKKDDKMPIGGVVKLIPIFLLIAMLISVFNIFLNTQNMNKEIDAELARAMEYDRVEPGEEVTQGEDGQECPYVHFDAFFLRDLDGDSYAEGVRGTCKEIGKRDTLYMELNVLTKGYLEKGAKITLNDDRNFYFETAIVKDNEIQENYIGSNIGQIKLKEIKNGTQKLLTGVVSSAIGNDIDKYSYSKKYENQNTMVFEGVHVIPAEESDTGEEIRTKIRKEIKLDVDWYGEANCTIRSTSQVNSLNGILDEEAKEVNLQFSISLDDSKNQLNLKTSKITATIPKLNNYSPKRVMVKNKNITSRYYDESTGILTAESSGKIDSETNIITSYPVTGYNVLVTYPIEAYEGLGADSVEIRVPVEAQLTAYNNPNDEFENPYITNIAKTTIVATYRNPSGTYARFDISVGRYARGKMIVSKAKPLKMYNGLSELEIDDTYVVRWTGNTGSSTEGGSMIFRDGTQTQENVSDVFITNNSEEQSMENVSKIIGIYFSNPENLLGEDGEIRVYDNENDMLLQTFTRYNWGNFNSNRPYRFEIPVNHIRVETSDVSKNSSLTVYLLKEIDDEAILENYSREDFDKLEHIKSRLSGYIVTKGEDLQEEPVNNIDYTLEELKKGHVNDASETALYEAPVTEVGISATGTAMTTQETYENDVFTIHARYYENSNEVKWINGVFLLKFPKEIIDVKINRVSIDDENVNIVSYEQYEETERNEKGEDEEYRFIKIITENEQESTYNIQIDCDITPDPRIPTTSRSVQLYAYNENAIIYSSSISDKYDINGNLSTEDIIGSSSVSLQLISPQSLLTSQTASEFDKEGSTVIAPQIAEIVKEQRDAKIDINLANNYTNNITEVKILVKIPSKGNKFVINGQDLGSTFDTYLVDGSIELPDEFKNVAKIYYTDVVDNLTKDIDNPDNRWTLQKPDDIKTVRAFLIDLGDYKLKTREQRDIKYKISIPPGIEYDEVSYSHHAVFFSLETENGKYRTQTEPNKLGFRLTKKYDMELIKYQTAKDRKVAGATYFIYEEKEEDTKEGRTKVTDREGKLSLEGLYIGRTYCIKEIKSPVQYELDDTIIKFTTKEEEDGTLTVQMLGEKPKNLKNISSEKESEEEDARYKVVVQVEDEVKGNLDILKTDRATGTPIANIKYRLTGKGFKDTGRIVTTGADGRINMSGLSLGAEYTLEEIRAEGYYLENTEEPIKFKIINDQGTFKEEVTQGTVKHDSITESEDVPTIHLEMEDNKIPTYNLTIKKIEDGKPENLLPGAKFRLIKGEKEIGLYETGSDGEQLGIITINDLYAYEDSKQIDQTYLLQEVASPLGYAKMQDVEFKVTKNGETYNFETIKGNVSDIQVEGNNITIILEDSPSFKLTKVDDKESTPLKNAKFVVYNIENGTEPARDSKGEIVGQKEKIDGKEYYVLTTDDNGEITADLPQGLYKAVEVKASDDKYALADETYFGIGMSKESPAILKMQTVLAMVGNKSQQITCVAPVKEEGGYILGGYFNSASIQIDGQDYTNVSSENEGMIIKVTEDNEVEWVSQISGANYENIYSVTQLEGGEYIAVGAFNSSQVSIKDNEGNVDETANSVGSYDGIIIRYDNSGNAIWKTTIGGTVSDDYLQSVYPTQDGGYVVGGYFYGNIDLGQGNNIQSSNNSRDGVIIKYSSDNEIEWTKVIGGIGQDEIRSVIETSDGGILIGGLFENSIQLDGHDISNSGSSDGIIIKYNKVSNDQKYEYAWTKVIGGTGQDHIKSVAEINNGDYVVVGNFLSATINLQVNNENTTLTNARQNNNDVIIVRYDKDGNAKWATSFGGTNTELATSVIKTTDGGFAISGYYQSSFTIEDNVLKNSGQDGFIIKYNENNEIKLLKTIVGSGSNGNENINAIAQINGREYVVGGFFASNEFKAVDQSITKVGSQDALVVRYMEEDVPNAVAKSLSTIAGNKDEDILASTPTVDGGYVVVGTFKTDTITVGENSLTNKGNEDGLIVKYTADGQVEWVNSVGGTQSEYINSVIQTEDEGYIVGGYFTSTSINLDGYLLNNSDTKENGMLIKYDSKGQVVWTSSFGESGANDRINSLVATEDGGYIAVGYFESSNVKVGENNLTNSGKSDGIIIKYNSNNQVDWVRQVKGNGSEQLSSVALTSDGGYVVGGKFDSTTIQVANKTLIKTTTGTTNSDALVIKINSEGTIENIASIGGDDNEEITAVSSSSEDGYIVAGNFRSKTIEIGNYILTNLYENSATEDGMIIKYTSNNQVEWATSIGGNYAESITSVTETADKGYIVTANFSTQFVQIDDFNLVNADVRSVAGERYSDGLIVKYDKDGIAEWAKTIGGEGHDYIKTVIKTNDERYVIAGKVASKTMKFGGFTLENTNTTTSASSKTSEGVIVKLSEEPRIPEQSVFEVRNKIKTFKITTAVEGKVGGEISGDLAKTKKVYEVVEYNDTNNKDGKHEIRMTPEPGYEIIRITINGVAQSFEKQEHNDGNYYILPAITEIKENKHIVVTYAQSSSIFTINKKDENGEEPLAEAVFKIEKIDTKESLDGVLKGIQSNNQTYNEPDYEYDFDSDEKGLKNVLGTMTANVGDYSFVADGETSTYPYKSNNKLDNTVANSYMKMNLDGVQDKKVAIVVNAKIDSEANYDCGFVAVTNTSDVPEYNTERSQFVDISGNVEEKSYVTVLNIKEGQEYYLHFGYKKDESKSEGTDTFEINSVKVYPVKEVKYNFTQEPENKYVSSNKGANTESSSYIEIDLSDKEGKYNVIVNAQIDSEENKDWGYATIVKAKEDGTVTAPKYDDDEGRFIWISGQKDARDYTTVLEGRNKYYLYFGYHKDADTQEDTQEDVFTINDIKVVTNKGDEFSKEVKTDELGKAIESLTELETYIITEEWAPEGYEVLNEATVYTMKADEKNEITITNKKAPKLVVHHYLLETKDEPNPTKLAEDENYTGVMGAKYETKPKTDLAEYELATDGKSEYIIDGEPKGTYTQDLTEVTYYYTNRKIPLVVHHYIEETLIHVPTANGGTAEDYTEEGIKGEAYTTNALKDANDSTEPDESKKLDEAYELTVTPDNAVGEYDYPEIEIIYEYDIKVHDITTKVTKHKEEQEVVREDGQVEKQEVDVAGGKISGEGQKPYEQVEHGKTSGEGDKEVKIEPNPGYQVKEGSIKVNGQQLQEKDYTVNDDGTITLKPLQNVTEDKEIEVEFERIPAKVLVNHYIYDSKQAEPHTTNPVPLKPEGTAEQEQIDGYIGKEYSTNPKDESELKEGYRLYGGDPENYCGTMDKPETIVNYYYIASNVKIEATKTSKVIDEQLEASGTEEGNARIGSKIEYTITAINRGNTAGQIVIKDSIPQGTQYVQGTLKVTVGANEDKTSEYTIDKLTGKGIVIDVPEATTNEEGESTPGTVTVQFTVEVIGTISEPTQGKAKLENGDIIKNKATIYVDPEDPENPEEPDDPEKKIETPETENKYIEPIIEGKKEAQIIGKDSEKVSGREYALEGESIEYTITVVNKGELEKEISVRDEVSKIDGILVEDEEVQIKVIDGEDEKDSTSTITKLESEEGITVTVPPAKDTGNETIEESEYGKVTLTFKVKINVLAEKEYSKQIKNVAIIKVDETDTEVETTTDVYKTNIIAEKTADPDPAEKPEVTKGDKIKYTITIRNEGEKEEKVLVKDSIPAQVLYDEETAKLEITGDEAEGANHKIAELDTAKGGEGVTVTVQSHSQVTISFEVTVDDLEDGTEIRNVATIKEDPDNPESEEKSTSEVVHKYVEPIIKAEKTAETSNGKGYVTAGDTINYTITLTNEGGLEKEVIVKDTIPEGATLVGTIKVDPKSESEPEGGYTQENLSNGIKVTVPSATISDSGEKTPRIVKIKFTVKVDEELDGTVKEIVNEAVINKDPENNPDPENPENPDDIERPKVETPVVTFTKTAEVERKDAESELLENEVTVGDTIKYTITVNNISTEKAVENIEVKDKIPEGTELVNETINNEGQYNAETNEITWTIAQIAKESSVELSFKVKVKYAIKDGTISNVATVDGKDTNEDEKEYKKPEPSIEHTMTKTAGANTVVEEIPVLTEDGGAIKYTITYEIAIKDYVGKSTVKIVDELPAKLNVDKMKELATEKGIQTTTSDWLKEFLLDGQYDETEQTITWTKTIDNIDTFTNGTYTETITKEISVVYMGQDVNAELENTAKGTTTLYYPEDDPDNEGPQLEETTEDTETVKQDYRVNLKVIKEWVDDNNRRDLQPQSIHISIKQEETNYTVEDYELNSANNWTFDNTKLPGYSKENALPKYSDTGELLKYVVTEKETIDHYNSEVMELTPDVQEEATNYTVKVINTFELTEEEIKNAEITKVGTPETITSSTDEIEYTITYSAEITDYEGNATVVIEDELPYSLDKEKMKVKASSKGIDTTKENWLVEYLDGGVYEEGTIGQSAVYKITWRISLGRINTYKQANETYIVGPITKEISLIYKDLDATQETIENTASGRVELDETQSPKEETTLETNVDIQGKLTVKYVDKETGRDLEEPQVSTGKVGDSYTTEEKQFNGYVLDSVEGERTGEYTEEDQTVTYYYTRPDADVTVKYVDEDGNPLTDDVVIPGKTGDPYTTEEKVFDGYILEKVEGDPEGTMDEEHKEVVYVYKRIPAKVIVRYLEKGTEKKLADEDTIQGYVGDDYVTERKPIAHYKAAEPEPDNATGKMKVVINPDNPNEIIEDTIIVTYYYDKIKSGKITIKHVDVDTGEEITYTEENEDGEKEEKKYGYDIEGYVGDKYETHEENIPYYDVVKIPENASGEFSEEEDTVTYYYKKKPFNFSVEKVIKNVLLNGEQKNITNNKSMKVEIVAGTISYAQLEITYAIQVSNTGEIDGKAKVQEILPEGYKLINVADYWKETEDGNLEAEVELKAGETKELEVTLKWINGSSNFGPFDNTVKVTDTENEANFKDINPDDDTSTAEIITSIKTGDEINIIAIVTEVLLVLIIVLLACIYYKKKH